MDSWYLTNSAGAVVGPVDTAFVLEELRQGRMTPASVVCRVGDQSWQPVSAVPALSNAFPVGPGPIPDPPKPGWKTRWRWDNLTSTQRALMIGSALLVFGAKGLAGYLDRQKSGGGGFGPGGDLGGLPACATDNVTRLAKQAVEGSPGVTAMGGLVVTISEANEVRNRPEPPTRVCRATLESRMGRENLFYTVTWQDRGQGIMYVYIMGNADNGQ